MKIYHGIAPIIENEPVAEQLWRLRLEAEKIAEWALPGQFLMLRIPGQHTPLLGRPLAIYNIVGAFVDVIYAVVGTGTALLAEQRAGMSLEVWGPLGNGWLKATETGAVPETPILVAGGIGQTPMRLLAEHFLKGTSQPVHLLMGSRDLAHLACVEDFQQLSANFANRLKVQIATDDGSFGHAGFVTDLLPQFSSSPAPHLYACGPQPMLKRVAAFAAEQNFPCHVSLETPMACGMGICFTCVVRCQADNDDGWDYCRTCVEGPIFDAAKMIW